MSSNLLNTCGLWMTFWLLLSSPQCSSTWRIQRSSEAHGAWSTPPSSAMDIIASIEGKYCYGTLARRQTLGGIVAQSEADHASEIQSQQMAAGAALSAKRGEKKVKELKGASRSMYESMT